MLYMVKLKTGQQDTVVYSESDTAIYVNRADAVSYMLRMSTLFPEETYFIDHVEPIASVPEPLL